MAQFSSIHAASNAERIHLERNPGRVLRRATNMLFGLGLRRLKGDRYSPDYLGSVDRPPANLVYSTTDASGGIARPGSARFGTVTKGSARHG